MAGLPPKWIDEELQPAPQRTETVGLTYMPALDGLRTIAVSAVLCEHFLGSEIGLAGAGVRLFFVISGYLISHILMSARSKGGARGQILRAFYARRTLRIFPAYYFALGISFVLSLEGMRETALWHLFYATNILFFLTNDWNPWPADHLWSLAVEEQFYLVWPILLLFAPLKRYGLAIVLAFVVMFASRGLLLWAFPNDEGPALQLLMPVHLDAFAGGALLALAEARGWLRPSVKAVIVLLGIVLAPLALGSGEWSQTSYYLVGYTLEIFTFAAMIIFARYGGKAAQLTLGNAAIVFLGKRSYGIYLYHNFIFAAFVFVPGETLQRAGWRPLLVGSLLSILAASLSWRYVERPLLHFKAAVPYVGRSTPD
jgi:peptidoglycan/LPS O-acetylase OafA/YrhL